MSQLATLIFGMPHYPYLTTFFFLSGYFVGLAGSMRLGRIGCGIIGHIGRGGGRGGGVVALRVWIAQQGCGMKNGTVSSNYDNDTPV